MITIREIRGNPILKGLSITEDMESIISSRKNIGLGVCNILTVRKKISMSEKVANDSVRSSRSHENIIRLVTIKKTKISEGRTLILSSLSV